MNTMCVSEWSGWITKSFDEIKICFCTLILIKAVHTQRLRPFQINEGIISYHSSIAFSIIFEGSKFRGIKISSLLLSLLGIKDSKFV